MANSTDGQEKKQDEPGISRKQETNDQKNFRGHGKRTYEPA